MPPDATIANSLQAYSPWNERDDNLEGSPESDRNLQSRSTRSQFESLQLQLEQL
ncbi:MAG: hypothetical protein EBE86_020520 [Hormoscilla sp. GUM202]|nr:hypothetical protein [Hormoscilla sp. GUM202]